MRPSSMGCYPTQFKLSAGFAVAFMFQEFLHDFLPGVLQFTEYLFQVLISSDGRTCRDIICDLYCGVLCLQIMIVIFWISLINGKFYSVRDQFSYILDECFSFPFVCGEILVGNEFQAITRSVKSGIFIRFQFVPTKTDGLSASCSPVFLPFGQ